MRRSMYACGFLFAAIGLAAIASGVAAGGDGTAGMVVFGVGFLAGAALFFWIGNWPVSHNDALQDTDLKRLGRPARATVLDVEPPALGAPSAGTQVTLRVTPTNERAFVTSAHLASPRPAPRVGDELRVKFDPNKRKHLVVLG